MGTIKILGFDEDGNAQRLKIRIARFLDYDPVTASDKSNIRSTLGITSQGGLGDLLAANNLDDVASLDTTKANLEIPDVGTSPQEVPLNQHLGSLAYQSAEAVSVDKLEVTDHIENFTVKSDGTSDSPAEITLQAEDGSINTDDRIGTLSIAGMDNSATPLTGAKIEAKADSTWSASTAPTRLEFSTTPSGSTSPSVRWTINSTGNLVASSGRGIDFGATNTTAGVTVTGSTLDHYEEGAATITDVSGAGLSLISANCNYTRIGNKVTCWITVTYPTTSDTSIARIGGLPYAFQSVNNVERVGGFVGYTDYGSAITILGDGGQSRVTVRSFATGGTSTNADLSGKSIWFCLLYEVS